MSPNIPSDNRAMTKFDISSNQLSPEGGTALAAGLKSNQMITELNISNNNLGYDCDGLPNTYGVIAIADAIPDMGALTSLNLSSNLLCGGGAKIVVEAIKVTKCAIATILVPFSCLSDLPFDCCCLPISTGQWGAIGVVFER
jgi:hypothetical protein